MAENKINSKLLVFTSLSFLLSLAAYIIYVYIPQSDLANSIEHSGKDALYVLLISPVASLISVVLLVLSYVLNKKYIEKIIQKSVALIVYVLVAVFTLISTVFSVMFVVSQFDLGFTAPITGTVWQTYSGFMLATCIVHIIFSAFLMLGMKSNSKSK